MLTFNNALMLRHGGYKGVVIMWIIYPRDLIIFTVVISSTAMFCYFMLVKGKKTSKVRCFFPCALSVVALIIFLSGMSGGYFLKYYKVEDANIKTYSKKELMEDFDKLEEYILEKNPLVFADYKELQDEFGKTREKVQDNMTEEQFYRLINPLAVSVKCGHTNLSVSQALVKNRRNTARFFPINVTVKGKKIVTGDGNERYGISAGDIILSINENNTDYILDKLVENISHDGDNPAAALYIAGNHFNYEYYEFIEQSNMFDILLKKKNGEEYRVLAEAEYEEKYNTAAWQLHMEDYKGVDYYNYKIDGSDAIMTVRVFFQGQEKFSEFLTRFITEIREKDVKKFTIDVRGNFGGRPDMAKELLSYLIRQETPYFSKSTQLPFLYKIQGIGNSILPKEDAFKGEIRLLTDGGCFSTCAHFCAVFKENGLGIIQGENTGGGAACTDSSIDVILRNTGIRLHNSQALYEVVADSSMRNVVSPDERLNTPLPGGLLRKEIGL